MLPPREGNNTPQTNSQAGALLPSREVSSPAQGINSTPVNSQFTPVSSQASGIPPNSTLAIALLPPGGGSNSLLAAAHLPSGERSSSSQAIAHLPSGEGSNSSQATALLPREGSSIPQATSSPQVGQSSNPTRSFRQGHRHSPRHRAPQSSQEKSTISQEDNPTTTLLVVHPKVLLMKNLTLSGSLTFPTNLWHQRKGLFWLKDPTLWLPPGSLLTY